MLTKEKLISAAKEAKLNNAYVFVMVVESEITTMIIPFKRTPHWFGSVIVEFVSDVHTFDNVRTNDDIIKILIPDDILKDTSLQYTVDDLNIRFENIKSKKQNVLK